MAEYIDKLELLSLLEKKIKADNERRMAVVDRDFIDLVNDATVISDIVEVDIIEKIIRKKADVSNYWQNYVKQYRAMQGYSNIEHDVDKFLRGYNEAVEDILAILDDTQKERGADKPKITCLNCKHLMFSDMYGECNKQLKIVNPSDTCEFAEPKERGGGK